MYAQIYTRITHACVLPNIKPEFLTMISKIVLLGLLFLIILNVTALVGILYRATRKHRRKTEDYELSLLNMENGQCDRAVTRKSFEDVTDDQLDFKSRYMLSLKRITRVVKFNCQ